MSEKLIDKIAKLLNLAERAATKEEARAFNEKAEALMIRYGIEEAAIQMKRQSDARPADPMTHEIIKITGTYNRAELSLAHSVAAGLATVISMQRLHGSSSCSLFVFGYQSDIDAFKALWKSLRMQAMREANTWAATNDHYKSLRAHEKNREKGSFIESFGNEVRVRLSQIRAQVIQDMTGEGFIGAEVALVDKRKQADTYAHQAFSIGKARATNRMDGGYEAMVAGRQAGQRADIGQKPVRS